MTTNEQIYSAIAASLRGFGYPHVTSAMVAEVHAAMRNGEPLPYGAIGMFAEQQLAELADA